jgi:uncharacterized protein (TIGR04222 family)
VEVEAGDPLKVTWHFRPASNTAHVFVVRYRADGVIRQGDGDTLIWRAIPEEHDYSIERSTITLTYPPEAAALEQPVLTWDFDSAWEANRIILTTSGIAENEDLIVTARFAPNSLTQNVPQWQVQKEAAGAARAKALPASLFAAIGTLILGGLGLFTYLRSNGRDLNINAVIPTAIPPQRGVLEVREEKGFWGNQNHVLVRKEHAVPLEPFEQGLMQALFKADETQINMSEAPGRLDAKKSLFDEPLEQELIQRGWLAPDRKQKRSMLLGVGFLALFLGLAVFIAAILFGFGWGQNIDLAVIIGVVGGAAIGIFILALALLIYAGAFSILTPAGEEQSARWKGFAEYLKQVSKGKEPAIRPDYFERYLAHASVFGLGKNWAKYFQELGGVPLPIWFHALAGRDANFGAIVAVMSASDSAGAGGGGAGGAGASGGGSSGAG